MPRKKKQVVEVPKVSDEEQKRAAQESIDLIKQHVPIESFVISHSVHLDKFRTWNQQPPSASSTKVVRVGEDSWHVYIRNGASKQAWFPLTEHGSETLKVWDTGTAIAWLRGLDEDAFVTMDAKEAATKYLDELDAHIERARTALQSLLELRNYEFLTS